MQTFLPLPSYRKSASVLDNRRLGKQRVEAIQIARVLTGLSTGWQHHPAVKMWRGYEEALRYYMNLAIWTWLDRGYKNTMKIQAVGQIVMPPWMGNEAFHRSHQSNLIRKDPAFYGPQFPGIPSDLPYVWPA